MNTSYACRHFVHPENNKQILYIFRRLYIHGVYIYIYIRLEIKPNSVRIRF